MAATAPALFLALAVAALLAAAPAEPANNPAVAPPPGPDCQTVLTTKLADCFTFVLNGSTDKVPSKGCCKGLATVLRDDLICICQLASNPSSGNDQAAQFGIDPDRVKMLPRACATRIPADKCAKLGLPIPTPLGAVGAKSPAMAPVPGGGSGGPVLGGGVNAPPPTSRAPRPSTTLTSSAWALLIAVGLPVLALAATSARV